MRPPLPLTLPAQFAPVAPAVRALLSKLAGKLDVGDADNRRQIALNREVFLSDEFRALWDRVKARTTYRVGLDPDALVADAAERIAELPPVARPHPGG